MSLRRLLPAAFLLLASTLAVAQTPPPTAPPSQGSAPAPRSPGMHDPSTIVRDGDLFYVFATGRGIPFFSSPDLHTWTRRGTVFRDLPADVTQYAPANDGRDGWAPDIIHLGNTFYLYYAVSTFGKFVSAIGLATNTTLDPANPAYHWVDRGTVIHSDGLVDFNTIDPAVILAPDGKLWLSFGSYRGGIQLIPLIPPSAQNDTIGLPLKPKKHPKELTANGDAEASDIIFHNGWFYLFVNHGSCCRGANSTYHITVGRSHKINGTYKDRSGTSLLDGPGEPFLASDSELIGPGHFGLVPAQPGDPTERFSLHYEAGPASNGHPTLAIRTLTWSSDGWPLAGPLQPTAAAPPPAQSF